ncbi:MAG: pyridoxal 5'-phosphate synthase glutaminase subunit PdxT [Candidatus Eremiobacteraeota bacterium]|nr:pyridoxal 5'-phosphate synthase glutaminase subunit PdxT [Candidatus Eremiobacteraeota bacterium]MBV8366841.1 pyridoxal 5'-phosphate synthase glutaminase subunit PdxT [Candidatus Eremiobacteraeota bacterium]
MSAPRIGVLGLQGDVEEHLAMLRRLKADARTVKTAHDLAEVDGLIIPGGESTTVGAMLNRFGLTKPLIERVKEGMPVWGTCMGMIVMAEHVVGSSQPTLGLLNIDVKRNAFGRQVESAEVPLAISGLSGKPFPGVFIRAPWIESARDNAKIMASLDGKGVMVRQGNLLGTSFHPELTDDPRIHKLFIDLVERVAPETVAR